MVSLIEFSGGAGAQTALEVNRDAWLLGVMNPLSFEASGDSPEHTYSGYFAWWRQRTACLGYRGR